MTLTARLVALVAPSAWPPAARSPISDDMPVALRVFEQLREQWRGRIDLQMAGLVSLDQWADPAAAHASPARLP